MKRSLLSVAAAMAALAGLTACAHSNGSSKAGAVRVVTSAQEVTSCEKLSQVRLSGTWTSGAAKAELEKLVQSKGGNVLLLTDASGTANAGVAYRCAGAGSGAP